MTVETMLKDCSTFFTHSMNELTRKAPDYTGPDGKAFGDLGEVAREMQCSRERVALVHAAKHWTAIRRYLLGNELQSEGIQKRLIDLANYCAMISVLLDESEIGRFADRVLGVGGLPEGHPDHAPTPSRKGGRNPFSE